LPVDVPLDDAEPDVFDALLLPGGVVNPDSLRVDHKAVAFVRVFFDAKKPVAAICHGPGTIINAGAARGRRMTSWPRSKWTFAMPAPNGWMRKRSPIKDWSRVVGPTSRRSIAQ
jgi:protease I